MTYMVGTELMFSLVVTDRMLQINVIILSGCQRLLYLSFRPYVF